MAVDRSDASVPGAVRGQDPICPLIERPSSRDSTVQSRLAGTEQPGHRATSLVFSIQRGSAGSVGIFNAYFQTSRSPYSYLSTRALRVSTVSEFRVSRNPRSNESQHASSRESNRAWKFQFAQTVFTWSRPVRRPVRIHSYRCGGRPNWLRERSEFELSFPPASVSTRNASKR